MTEGFTFYGEVQKIQTTADNGISVTLGLQEDGVLEMAKLAECKRHGIYLQFDVTEYRKKGLKPE